VGRDQTPFEWVARTASDGTFADPSVRISQWARSYGENGTFLSICDGNWGSSVDRIAALLNQTITPTP